MTLKSSAQILSKPTSQLLRDQQTAYHAPRIHGCMVVENEG
jgi:hypothetical protein